MAAAPRRALIVLLALVSVFGSPGVAQAAVSGNTGWTYFTTNGPCVWTQAQMRDDWGKPWAQSYAFYDYWAGGDNTTACADHSRNAPTGRLSVRQDLYFWNTNTNAWTICNQGDWYTNVTPSHVAATEFAWGKSSVLLGPLVLPERQGLGLHQHPLRVRLAGT